MKIPTFKVEKISESLDITDYINDADLFYRRIVQYVMNKIDGTETNSVLCYIIIEEKNKIHRNTFILEKEGWHKSLNKALEYFANIEEYETCELIKQIKQTI
jgi:hypothetical protein